MDQKQILELASACEQRAIEAAQQALDYTMGGSLSSEWISEAAHYATISKFVRTLASGGDVG